MVSSQTRVLLVEDNDEHAHLIEKLLRRCRDFEIAVHRVCRLGDGLKHLAENQSDAVLLDLRLPDSDGIGTLLKTLKQAPPIPVLVLTSLDDAQLAIKAVQRGAQNYLVKSDLTPDLLARSIQYAIEHMRITRELEQSNRDLEAFAYVASHDIQAPLRRIAQFGRLVKRRIQQQDYASVESYVDTMVSNAEELRRLTDSLLDYARLGKANGPLKPLSLFNVIKQAIRNLETVINEANARVLPEFSTGSDDNSPVVLGDEVSLPMVFQNLLANALKFRREDDPPVIRIAIRQQSKACIVSVADNGIGIDTNDMESIFAPFRRLHGQNEFEGSGIGLSTCQKIVERHKGRIWVESQPGEGSTFFVSLVNANR